MTTAEFAEAILIVLIASGGIFNLLSLFCVMEFFGGKREVAKQAGPSVPVSILKPLRGMDPEFRENILSFCRQDYPEYEVLLGFGDADDDAISAARDIAKTEKNVRVVISPHKCGTNKKIANLQGLLDEAKHPLVAISDSDMRVGPDYLAGIVNEYRKNEAGMVTSLYKISYPGSIGTALESLTLAIDFIPSVLVARRLEGVTFGLGASMLVSRDAIEEIGGLRAIADYLADDYQIGNRLWKRGHKIVISEYVIEDVEGCMDISDYLVHQVRWARTYRASRPKGYLGYGISHILPFSLLLLALRGTDAVALSFLGAVVALRFCLACAMYTRAIGSRGWLKWLFLVPVKDILSFGIWLSSFAGKKVLWRGRYYLLLKGGKIEEVREDGK